MCNVSRQLYSWHGRIFFIAVYGTPAFAFISLGLLIVGAILLKDLFDYVDCPDEYPEICRGDVNYCCTTPLELGKIVRPTINTEELWKISLIVPTALAISITACFNRKLNFHPIL